MKKLLSIVCLLFSLVAFSQTPKTIVYNQSRTQDTDWNEDYVEITYHRTSVVVSPGENEEYTFLQIEETVTGEQPDGQPYHAAKFVCNEREVIIQKLDNITFARIIFDAENYIELRYINSVEY
jgi:hypothetical protein